MVQLPPESSAKTKPRTTQLSKDTTTTVRPNQGPHQCPSAPVLEKPESGLAECAHTTCVKIRSRGGYCPGAIFGVSIWTLWTNGPKFSRAKTGGKRNKKGFCDIILAPSFEQPTPQGPGLLSFDHRCRSLLKMRADLCGQTD